MKGLQSHLGDYRGLCNMGQAGGAGRPSSVSVPQHCWCLVNFTLQGILGLSYLMTVVSPSLGDRQMHIVLCPQGTVSLLAEILFHLKSKKDTLHLMQLKIRVV